MVRAMLDGGLSKAAVARNAHAKVTVIVDHDAPGGPLTSSKFAGIEIAGKAKPTWWHATLEARPSYQRAITRTNASSAA